MIISNRQTFILGLALLCLSGVLLILGHPGFALRIINAIFFVLVFATILYIWETKSKNEK